MPGTDPCRCPQRTGSERLARPCPSSPLSEERVLPGAERRRLGPHLPLAARCSSTSSLFVSTFQRSRLWRLRELLGRRCGSWRTLEPSLRQCGTPLELAMGRTDALDLPNANECTHVWGIRGPQPSEWHGEDILLLSGDRAGVPPKPRYVPGRSGPRGRPLPPAAQRRLQPRVCGGIGRAWGGAQATGCGARSMGTRYPPYRRGAESWPHGGARDQPWDGRGSRGPQGGSQKSQKQARGRYSGRPHGGSLFEALSL
jgi:hypothetical protein